MKLKVYGTYIDGRHRVICACNSFAKFKELTGADINRTSRTNNDDDIRIAMSKPFQPFFRHGQSEEWKEFIL